MAQFCIAAFCVLFGSIVYSLFLYPLLLAFLASRRRPAPIVKDNVPRSVSFVIAARNGGQFLEQKMISVLALDYPRDRIEIVIVSDGSDDATDEIARRFEPEGVRFLRVPRGGKPSAVNAGVALTSGELLVFTDVRQTLDPACLRNAVACFADPSIGAVSAELQIRKGETNEEEDTSRYWRFEVWMRMQMGRIDSTFGCNGPFYILRRSLWEPIPPDTLIDDAWLPLTAFFKGYRLILEPSARASDFPTGLDSEFRRKVRTVAGLYQLLWMMPELLSSNNRMRLHFLSGKYSRIMVPWCLLGMLAVTAGMPSPWRANALVIQAVFYGLAGLDLLIPAGFSIKRFTSPVRTFVVLMTAALFAVRILFVPPRTLWKETTVRHLASEAAATKS